MKDKGNKTFYYILIVLIVIILFTAVASYFYYKSDNAVGPNLITAFVGVVLSALVTLVLLNGQTKDEEEKERKMKLYNAKLRVYSNFVSMMYEALSDGEITKPEMIKLRTYIFGKISFYAKRNTLTEIREKLTEIKDFKDIRKMQPAFAAITNILQNDLRNSTMTEKDVSDTRNVSDLWGTFETLFANSTSSDSTEPESQEKNDTVTLETNSKDDIEEPQELDQTFWHFAMWDANEQLKAQREGVYELNLVEYDEEWRTNLIKQVKENDLVFLFRSGGWGYMGVYCARGWRIFEFGENDIIETIHIFGEEERLITDKITINEDLKRSDIYKSKEDGATLCSSIIVEPLAFSKDGIGNPGGVYRRTISRYDKGYGIKQLARFMAIMNNENLFDIQNGIKMGCNKELFQKILAKGNIQPAPRDTNGNWL